MEKNGAKVKEIRELIKKESKNKRNTKKLFKFDEKIEFIDSLIFLFFLILSLGTSCFLMAGIVYLTENNGFQKIQDMLLPYLMLAVPMIFSMIYLDEKKTKIKKRRNKIKKKYIQPISNHDYRKNIEKYIEELELMEDKDIDAIPKYLIDKIIKCKKTKTEEDVKKLSNADRFRKLIEKKEGILIENN